MRKGCDFLFSKQLPDGGWGETLQSCLEKRYVSTSESTVAQTSWSLLGLMAAGVDLDRIKQGIAFLVKSQRLNGEWDGEGATGFFSSSCPTDYTYYKLLFPLWTLNRYKNILCSKEYK